MTLQQATRDELARRRARNARYSLRAFARDLGISHSTLSRLLLAQQSPSDSTLREVGARLGWTAGHIDEIRCHERRRRLCRVVGASRVVPDLRSLAASTNLSMDDCHVALQDALRLGHLTMTTTSWTVNH